jgi:hypothetical protein
MTATLTNFGNIPDKAGYWKTEWVGQANSLKFRLTQNFLTGWSFLEMGHKPHFVILSGKVVCPSGELARFVEGGRELIGMSKGKEYYTQLRRDS